MSTRSPSEVSRLWFGDMWNNRDTGLLRELMAPDATGIFENGRTMHGPDDFIAFQQAFLEAVPDLNVELVRMVSEGDDVCAHWRVTGTHQGPGLGGPPSGKRVEFQGVTWLTVKNGQIVDGQDFWNEGGLVQHLAAT